MNDNWKTKCLPAIGPLLLFLLWQLAVSSKWLNPLLLPSPVDTLRYLFQSLWDAGMRLDIGATLYRTLVAFVISAVIGVPLGVALGSNEKLYRSLEFLIDFFRSMPSSALIPLFLLIFGITDANKIAISAFAAVLVILFNSAYGVMNAKKTRLMVAKVMGISRWHTFKDIMLLESLAQTFVGLRTGVSMALVIVIVAEMFIGSETGLGHRIIDAQQVFNIRDMYASILITGALGYLLNDFFLNDEEQDIQQIT